MASGVNLNLARKWRSQNFDQIVGQDLVVRMLKNSLYKEQFFPVYLFSGLRGCGKTSAARIFAAALNCEQLSSFQKKPQDNKIPCLSCRSCKAMQAGTHPDFIEIDAASYTGVDNVRQIISDASLLPLMGVKRIYLIDEAHMLSRAAFNAFLKILEEPPRSALFILATTDPYKIIDTVRSRCFQLFFTAVAQPDLQDHLARICDAENIVYDQPGLALICKETQGLVRDALNMIERVRFSSSAITKQSVLQVLGHIEDEKMFALAHAVFERKPAQVLKLINSIGLDNYSASFIWDRWAALIKAVLWIKYGATTDQFFDNPQALRELAQKVSFARLNTIAQTWFENEPVFSRTSAQHSLIEMLLVQFAYSPHEESNEGGITPASAPQSPLAMVPSGEYEEVQEQEVQEEYAPVVPTERVVAPIQSQAFTHEEKWQQFVASIAVLNDPLISSVFCQGQVDQFNEQTGELTVSFSKDFAFFQDALTQSYAQWSICLQRVFGSTVRLKQQFILEPRKKASSATLNQVQAGRDVSVKKDTVLPAIASNQVKKNYSGGRAESYSSAGAFNRTKKPEPFSPSGSMIDVSDVAHWPHANLILQHFPGTIIELEGQRV